MCVPIAVAESDMDDPGEDEENSPMSTRGKRSSKQVSPQALPLMCVSTTCPGTQLHSEQLPQ